MIIRSNDNDNVNENIIVKALRWLNLVKCFQLV